MPNATTSRLFATAPDLAASLDPVVPIFVLIDPMVGEPLSISMAQPDMDIQSMREASWQRPIMPIALSERCSLQSHQRPYLVALSGTGDPLLEVTLELAHSERAAATGEGLDGDGMAIHRIGGWLQSSMHSEQLAEQIALMFRVNTAAQSKATYLRLADRRALALLRHVAGDDRTAAQFGRLQRWVYLDVCGKLASLQSTGEEACTLRISREEWFIMEQGEVLNRTLAQWLGEADRLGDDRLSFVPTQELYPRLQTAVENTSLAVRRWPHRFPALADQTAWAALSLLHAALPLSATVSALMQQQGTPDDPAEPFRYMRDQVGVLLQADLTSAAI